MTKRTSGTALRLSLFTLGALLILGCGSGSGSGAGGDMPADLTLEVTPRRIDTGDRIDVNVGLYNVNIQGIILKIQYPKGLQYLRGSAYLFQDKKQIDYGPDISQRAEDGTGYLVFFLSQSLIEDNKYEALTVQFEGELEVKDGKIAVDADYDVATAAPSRKFNVDNPKFSAVEEITINVNN